MIRSFLFLFAALAVTSPAIAKDKEAGADSEKKVCRYEGATGSMMRKRTCHTAAEWKAIDTANAASARAMIDRNTSNRPAIGQ